MQSQRLTRIEVVTILVVLALAVAVFLPLRLRQQDKALRTNCAGNLKIIGLALLMYAGDFDGYVPNDHANGSTNFKPSGVDRYTGFARVWQCPARKELRNTETDSCYRYIGSGLRDDTTSAVAVSLAYDMSGNHRHNAWMNVLLLDGHTEGGKPGTVSAKGVEFSND